MDLLAGGDCANDVDDVSNLLADHANAFSDSA
jgi:hypothetical protein